MITTISLFKFCIKRRLEGNILKCSIFEFHNSERISIFPPLLLNCGIIYEMKE